MKQIYTSRFANKELETGEYTVVGVVRGMPKFPVKYKISGNIRQIAPPAYLWNENDREKFTKTYFEYLEKSGCKQIDKILKQYLRDGKDVVLCCYEDVRKAGEWCHRLVFAEWWYEKTGQRIEELTDPSPVAGKKKPAKREEDIGEQYEQLSFMDELYRDMYPLYRT